MTPERLEEIRHQVAYKFPSWTAAQELLEELDRLQAQLADPYAEGYLVKFVEAQALKDVPENHSTWDRVIFALIKGNQHHEQDRASTAQLEAILNDPSYHLCPARRFEKACPYPSVCKNQEECKDGGY